MLSRGPMQAPSGAEASLSAGAAAPEPGPAGPRPAGGLQGLAQGMQGMEDAAAGPVPAEGRQGLAQGAGQHAAGDAERDTLGLGRPVHVFTREAAEAAEAQERCVPQL